MFSFDPLHPTSRGHRSRSMAGVVAISRLAALLVVVLAVGARAAAVGDVGLRRWRPCWALQASCCFAAIAGAAGRCWWRALALEPGGARCLRRLAVARAHGPAWCTSTVPRDWWPPPDPVLGFRPRPNSEVIATATYGPARRSIDAPIISTPRRARVTPPAPAGADTYLFIGDSFIFGQGLPDDETLAAQFAKVQRLQGARSQSRRAGQRAEPSRARLRGGPARPLRRRNGQGGGDLDHPGAARARHRRRLVARLLAALRAGGRRAAPHRLVQRIPLAQSHRRRQATCWASSSPSSTRSAGSSARKSRSSCSSP